MRLPVLLTAFMRIFQFIVIVVHFSSFFYPSFIFAMLDWLGVVSKGGILEWNTSFSTDTKSSHSLVPSIEFINAVRELILKDYPANQFSSHDNIHSFFSSNDLFQLDWTMDSKFIYVTIHPKMIALPYIPAFLVDFKTLFIKSFNVENETEFSENVFELLSLHESGKIKSVEMAADDGKKGSKTKTKSTQNAKQRIWDLQEVSNGKISASLDFSNREETEDVAEIRKKLLGLLQSKPKDSSHTQTKKSSSFSSLFSSIVTGKSVTEEQRILLSKKLFERLMERNVAQNVALHISNAAAESLVSCTVGPLSSGYDVVLQAAKKAIENILTPTHHSDLLQDIREWRKSHPVKPFSIVFVGVNGVGKSTNLSKICYLLLQQKLKVLIAACDTFRSGAVEQLKVHVKNLSILSTSSSSTSSLELYQKGYGKDPSAIARDAYRYAESEGFDVLLVDTAGRMQDNEPLMRSLGLLASSLHPNRILFVGEALVGSEATDQLANFNKALQQWGSGSKIDGIVLTKFDTVDECVGAALSMSWEARVPVLYVGTGQTYTDLKKPNIEEICETLLY